MPFIGGDSRGATRACAKPGIDTASEKLYRCPADNSLRQPFLTPAARWTASPTAPAT